MAPSRPSSETERAPHSWVKVFLGLIVFGAAAAACGVLAVRFLQSRPVDLREHTSALAGFVEQFLVRSHVPQEAIRRGEPQPQSDPTATWLAYTFEVDLPSDATARALVPDIDQAVQPYQARAVEGPAKGTEHEAAVSLDGHTCITLRLIEHPKTDLTLAAARIADEVQVILQTQGIAPEAIHRAAPEAKEDEHTRWVYTRIEAPLPEGQTAESLEPAVVKAVTEPDAKTMLRLGTQGSSVIAVTLGSVDCVEVVLSRGTMAPEEDASFGLDLPALRQPDNGAPVTVPRLEDLQLDSYGLDAADLSPKLTGIAMEHTTAPKVAILVDDGGYNGALSEKFLALNSNLTVAVLPDTPFAHQVAQRAAELGFEVLLHMPMDHVKCPGQITVEMTCEQILERARKALEQIPNAKGVNNHMGSGVTANEKAITCFLEFVKEHNLFYVDSRTTGRSKAVTVCRKLGIKTTSRDVFLDNEKDADYIIKQFNELIQLAKERGRAVGICHFRPTTLPILTEMLTQIDRNGIQLVHVSELLQ